MNREKVEHPYYGINNAELAVQASVKLVDLLGYANIPVRLLVNKETKELSIWEPKTELDCKEVYDSNVYDDLGPYFSEDPESMYYPETLLRIGNVAISWVINSENPDAEAEDDGKFHALQLNESQQIIGSLPLDYPQLERGKDTHLASILGLIELSYEDPTSFVMAIMDLPNMSEYIIKETMYPISVSIEDFANEMEAEMKEQFDRGRRGWNDPQYYDSIKEAFMQKVAPGQDQYDWVSIANYAMMLHSQEKDQAQAEVLDSLEAKAEDADDLN